MKGRFSNDLGAIFGVGEGIRAFDFKLVALNFT